MSAPALSKTERAIAAPDRARRGRPPSVTKRNAIMHAAQQAFMTHGFARVSMDEIAERANVSKLTLYRHFGSKAELFATVIRHKCDSMLPLDQIDSLKTLPLPDALATIGRQFLALILSDEALALNRLIVLEGDRDPEMAQIFFENAVERTLRRVADFLSLRRADGEISIEDPLLAAGHYVSLLKAMPHMCAQLHLPLLGSSSLEQHILRCAALVLKAWRD